MSGLWRTYISKNQNRIQAMKMSALIFCLGLTCCPALRAQTLVRDGRDMSKVKDVINGQHVLLQNDDITMLQVSQDHGSVTTSLVTLDTSDSKLSDKPQTTAITKSTYTGAFDPSQGVTASQGTGRMYNTKKDIIALLNAVDSSDTPPLASDAWMLTLYDPPVGGFQKNIQLESSFKPYGAVYTQLAMGDFNGDGLSDPLVFYLSLNASKIEWGMKVLTAADPNAEGSLKEGPEFHSSGDPVPVTGSIVVGDFNGDGRDEIAALLTDYQTIAFYTVDPTTLTITQIHTVKMGVKMVSGQVALAAGRFRNQGSDPTNADLVVFGQIDQKGNGYSVIPFKITPTNTSDGTFTVNEVQKANATTDEPFFRFPDYHGAVGALAQAAPLAHWPQQVDEQLVLGIKTKDGASYIEIGTFVQDNTLKTFDWESETERKYEGQVDSLQNMWVGNFDNLDSDGKHSAALQIETYEFTAPIIIPTIFQPHINIFDVNVPSPLLIPVNEKTNWLKQKSDNTSGVPLVGGDAPRADILVPGDFQGRSLRLGGPPEIVRFPGQIQPDFVLGMPPMHVDYIAPGVDQPNQAGCPDSTTPCVFNLTFVPVLNDAVAKPFTTTLNLSSTSSTQGKRTSTTSWGVSVKTSIGESASFNDGLENASESITASASYAHDHNVSSTYNTFSGTTDKLDVSTGTSDYVLWTKKGMNIYYYPVLGQTGCPNGSSTCSDPVPTYVQFSIPDRVSHTAGDATTQDWYQPIHEPGNIFSYPWSKELLAAQFTNPINTLTKDPQCFLTGGTSKGTFSAEWSKGSGSSQSSGSTNSFSTDLSISTSEGVGVSDVDGADVTAKFDFGASTSFSTLNENTSSQSASTGVVVNVPSFDNIIADCCTYYMKGYIFGLTNPTPPAQKIPVFTPGSDPKKDPTPVDIATAGPLFAEFMADPVPDGTGMNCGSGSSSNNTWWQGVYNKPDVALNHPARWNWDSAHQTATIYPVDRSGATSPLNQPFYEMKGFFITKANQNGPTPTVTETTAGDQLTLKTRVYNYSLKDTPVKSVYARFYGQLYCASDGSSENSCINPQTNKTCTSGNLCGDSFLLGENLVSSIPGFKSSTASPNEDQPNWTTTSVNFDTSKYPAIANGNAYMVFWVVVWMEDASGNLVDEMPGHGLTTNPRSASLKQITDVPIQCQSNTNSQSNTNNCYSNNVGMYHETFHILPRGTLLAATPSDGSLQSITLSTVSQTLRQQRTQLSAKLNAAGASVRHVDIAYYDGDPANGGKLLDVQGIAYMDPGATYAHQTFFTPQTCGVHTLYAAAWIGDGAAVQSSATTNVTIQPVDEVQALITSTQHASITNTQLRSTLLSLLNIALQAFQQGQTQLGETTLATYVQELAAANGNGINASAVARLIGQSSVLLGCRPKGFSLSTLTSSAEVSAGSTTSYALAVTPSGGFKGAVSLSCDGAPRGATCSISSQSVTLDGTTQSPVTVTITTTSRTAAAGLAAGPPPTGPGRIAWFVMLLLTTLGIALLQRERRRQIVLGCVALLMLLSSGCGSSSHSSTPAGTYNVTVSAMSGSTVQNASIKLIVK